MANLWILDSFDIWDQSHPRSKWQLVADPASLAVSALYGRNGGGLRLLTGGTYLGAAGRDDGLAASACAMLESIFRPSGTWTIGFAFKFMDIAPIGTHPICSIISSLPPFEDFLGTYRASYISLYFCPDQRLRFVHGDFRTPSYRKDFGPPLRRGVYYYIEWQTTISAGGNIAGWIDGEPLVNEGQDLSRSIIGVPLGAPDGVRFFFHKGSVGGGRNARYYYLDDVYVTDTARFSDVTVDSFRPDGVGNSSQWTPNTIGFPNYTYVDDLTPDDDNTNLTAAAGLTDTYAHSIPVETGGAVHGIDINVSNYNKVFDDGYLAAVVRQSGSDDVGPAKLMGTISYVYAQTGYLLNPHTGVAFTQAELAADEFGFKRLT